MATILDRTFADFRSAAPTNTTNVGDMIHTFLGNEVSGTYGRISQNLGLGSDGVTATGELFNSKFRTELHGSSVGASKDLGGSFSPKIDYNVKSAAKRAHRLSDNTLKDLKKFNQQLGDALDGAMKDLSEASKNAGEHLTSTITGFNRSNWGQFGNTYSGMIDVGGKQIVVAANDAAANAARQYHSGAANLEVIVEANAERAVNILQTKGQSMIREMVQGKQKYLDTVRSELASHMGEYSEYITSLKSEVTAATGIVNKSGNMSENITHTGNVGTQAPDHVSSSVDHAPKRFTTRGAIVGGLAGGAAGYLMGGDDSKGTTTTVGAIGGAIGGGFIDAAMFQKAESALGAVAHNNSITKAIGNAVAHIR